MSYGLKRVLVIGVLFSYNLVCTGQELSAISQRLYGMPSELRHMVLQELVNSADTLPDAIKQIKKLSI